MGPHRPIGWAHRPREEEEEGGWRNGGWSWWWVLVLVVVVVVGWVGGPSVLPLVVAGRLPRPLHQGMGRWASAQPVHHHPERLPPGELRVPPHHLVGGPHAGLLPLPRAQLHQSAKHQLHHQHHHHSKQPARRAGVVVNTGSQSIVPCALPSFRGPPPSSPRRSWCCDPRPRLLLHHHQWQGRTRGTMGMGERGPEAAAGGGAVAPSDSGPPVGSCIIHASSMQQA